MNSDFHNYNYPRICAYYHVTVTKTITTLQSTFQKQPIATLRLNGILLLFMPLCAVHLMSEC